MSCTRTLADYNKHQSNKPEDNPAHQLCGTVSGWFDVLEFLARARSVVKEKFSYLDMLVLRCLVRNTIGFNRDHSLLTIRQLLEGKVGKSKDKKSWVVAPPIDCARTTIERILKKLQAWGFIKIINNGLGFIVYQLTSKLFRECKAAKNKHIEASELLKKQAKEQRVTVHRDESRQRVTVHRDESPIKSTSYSGEEGIKKENIPPPEVGGLDSYVFNQEEDSNVIAFIQPSPTSPSPLMRAAPPPATENTIMHLPEPKNVQPTFDLLAQPRQNKKPHQAYLLGADDSVDPTLYDGATSSQQSDADFLNALDSDPTDEDNCRAEAPPASSKKLEKPATAIEAVASIQEITHRKTKSILDNTERSIFTKKAFEELWNALITQYKEEHKDTQKGDFAVHASQNALKRFFNYTKHSGIFKLDEVTDWRKTLIEHITLWDDTVVIFSDHRYVHSGGHQIRLAPDLDEYASKLHRFISAMQDIKAADKRYEQLREMSKAKSIAKQEIDNRLEEMEKEHTMDMDGVKSLAINLLVKSGQKRIDCMEADSEARKLSEEVELKALIEDDDVVEAWYREHPDSFLEYDQLQEMLETRSDKYHYKKYSNQDAAKERDLKIETTMDTLQRQVEQIEKYDRFGG